jgi:phytoene dehydrogenase-like protein
MKRVDVAVIGSGPGGLGVAALLAKEGKKVTVLEKNGRIGGRATSFQWKGYTLNVGPHGGVVDRELDGLLRRVGKEPPPVGKFDDAVTYKDGEFVPLLSLIQPDDPDLLKVMNVLLGVTPEELAVLDAVSAKDWLDSLEIRDDDLRTLLTLGVLVGTTLPRLEDVAASAAIEALRPLTSPPEICWTCHGVIRYMQELADAVTEQGGEVRTNAEVTKIIVENHQVRGVLVEEGDKQLPGEVREGYVLEAQVVVAAFPIWDLFNVTSTGLYPPWFVDRVEMLNRTTAFFGIYAGCREPLFEEKWWVLMESPRTGYPFAAYMETNVCPQLAPEGEHLFNCCYLAEPELNKAAQREHLHELFELARQDLEELYPGWEEKCLWIKPFFHEFEEPARTPGRAGVFRPGPKAPGIKGLYFAGDTVNARALPGLECAAASAMQCADAILEAL